MKTGERLIRGFRRVGIVAAVPCLIAASIIAGYGAVADYQLRPRETKPTSSGALTFDDIIPPTLGQPANGSRKEPQLVPVDYDPFAKSKLSAAAMSRSRLLPRSSFADVSGILSQRELAALVGRSQGQLANAPSRSRSDISGGGQPTAGRAACLIRKTVASGRP